MYSNNIINFPNKKNDSQGISITPDVVHLLKVIKPYIKNSTDTDEIKLLENMAISMYEYIKYIKGM